MFAIASKLGELRQNTDQDDYGYPHDEGADGNAVKVTLGNTR